MMDGRFGAQTLSLSLSLSLRSWPDSGAPPLWLIHLCKRISVDVTGLTIVLQPLPKLSRPTSDRGRARLRRR